MDLNWNKQTMKPQPNSLIPEDSQIWSRYDTGHNVEGWWVICSQKSIMGDSSIIIAENVSISHKNNEKSNGNPTLTVSSYEKNISINLLFHDRIHFKFDEFHYPLKIREMGRKSIKCKANNARYSNSVKIIKPFRLWKYMHKSNSILAVSIRDAEYKILHYFFQMEGIDKVAPMIESNMTPWQKFLFKFPVL